MYTVFIEHPRKPPGKSPQTAFTRVPEYARHSYSWRSLKGNDDAASIQSKYLSMNARYVLVVSLVFIIIERRRYASQTTSSYTPRSPYYPASNGVAERMIGVLTNAVPAMRAPTNMIFLLGLSIRRNLNKTEWLDTFVSNGTSWDVTLASSLSCCLSFLRQDKRDRLFENLKEETALQYSLTPLTSRVDLGRGDCTFARPHTS